MLGTPDYIAPEQIVDARRADIRADIYSLGCTFYYLLTGGPPFQAASLYEIFQAHHSHGRDAAEPGSSGGAGGTGGAGGQDDGQGAEPAVPGAQGGGAGAEAVLQGWNAAATSEAGRIPGRSSGGGRACEWDDLYIDSAGAWSSGGPAVRAKKGVEPTVPEPRWESLIEIKEASAIVGRREGETTLRPRDLRIGLRGRPRLAIAAASLFGFLALLNHHLRGDRSREITIA